MTSPNNAPTYTQRFWAKAYPYRQQGPERIHLLEHHLADVGACFEALLAQPTIRQRLARSGGLDGLDDVTAARLALLAALHDIGKVNVGFQTQVWRGEDLPGGRRPPSFHNVGHTLDLAPVLMGQDSRTAGWFFDALGWWQSATESWDDRGGETMCALFVAALSHHGMPVQLQGNRFANPAVWRRFGELDPRAYVERIGLLAREWFPAAFASDAPPLSSEPAFQHHFLGLCSLADWIGSNEDWFPLREDPEDDYMEEARRRARGAVGAIGLDLSRQRSQLAGAPGFDALFPHIGLSPNAIQRAAAQATPLPEPLVIVESETGSGKTEAALWRFARMYEASLVDGLYFALPTRAAAVQIHGRIKRFIASLFPDGHRPPVVLAVPGYDPDEDAREAALQGYRVWWDSHYDNDRPWATENPKRYLAAQIAVGTVDQAMMGALKVKHAHMRAACLARNLLVVDEVHASDTYMGGVLKALLDAHLGAGGYALLMSATLGSAARRRWLSVGRVDAGGVDGAPPMEEAIRAHYPAVSAMAPGGERVAAAGENNQEKTVGIEAAPEMQDFEAVAYRALTAARAGAKVLVVRNTVAYAVETQRAVEQAAAPDRDLLFDCQGTPTLHHGRFAAGDRRLLDAQVELLLGKERGAGGRVVVGTQTLEQSLDIDADLLITDLCPVDVLLQRIGRLHRHPRADRPKCYDAPACVVLTPDNADLSPLLARRSDANGLGPHGYVYEDLRTLEATRRLIARYREWRIPEMNRLLVERATHPEALEAIVREMGEGDWRVHAKSVAGGEIAEGLTADSAIIRRDKSFFTDNHDVLFGTAEERIRTRLGDEGINVELDPQLPSPFDSGGRIDKIAVPVRWLGGAAIDGPVTPVAADGGFTFRIGDRAFRYDRLGLRRED